MPLQPAHSAVLPELLLTYQSAVVHDLRGDLNGLLLTLDFLRRQLAGRPETASLFGESLGDLDHVRTSLTRTLNQLEAVGHARRVVGGREQPSAVEQNLADVVTDLVHALGEKVRRRNIAVARPPSRDVMVNVDPVLLQLVLHRLLTAIVDLSRNAELRLSVTAPAAGVAGVRAEVSDAKPFPPDLLDRAANVAAAAPPIPNAVLAIGLAMRLAEQLGGSLRRAAGEGGAVTFELEFPAGTA